jgi:hypothetical protein
LNGQQAIDCPDLLYRVFVLKVRELLADLKNHVFRQYTGHIYTIEYQKCGLPYIYLLLFLRRDTVFLTPDLVNEVICTELPDPLWDPTGELTAVVTGQMSHGPYGLNNNPKALYIVRYMPAAPLACQKRFPKVFTAITIICKNGYPEYRYRNNGRIFTVRKPGFPGQEVVYNNRWIVPYNPYLFQKFHSHINIEVCISV